MNFFVVLLVDGREWRRANIIVDGEPNLGEVARRLLEEWRREHREDEAFDRLSVRIEREPPNA
jgi:hypothetical protein